jgi:hypothetical protein
VTQQYRQVPTFDQQIATGITNNSYWYRYFQDSDTGRPPTAEFVLTVPASPFIYTAPRKGFLIVQGGTVSAIAFSRSGTFYTTGQTTGTFPVGQGDQLKVTYSGKPNVIFVPT